MENGPHKGKDEEVIVEDGRKQRFGIVHMADYDSDLFRSLTPAHRLVYVSLCMFAGRSTGQCYPKVSKICSMTGFDRATVFRALAKLEEKGFLERSKKHFNRARRVNLYFLKSPSP